MACRRLPKPESAGVVTKRVAGAMSASLPPGFESIAAASPDPERARLGIGRLAEAWPAELPALDEVLTAFGERLPALAHLLAVSPVSADKLVRDPAALAWLSAAE